ncbi:MAG TPA: hypothetical protein VI299_06575 [Polyangiales bacterium]
MRRYLTIILFWLAAGTAYADMRVAVHDFYGPQGERLRRDVVELLAKQDGLNVVTPRQLHIIAQKLEVDAFSPQGRKAIARELGVSAWLTGVVNVSRKGARLRVMVYDGADHTCMGGTTLAARHLGALRGLIKRSFWGKTKSAIMDAIPPLPEGRAPVEEIASHEVPVARDSGAENGAADAPSDTPSDAAYMKPRTSRTTHAAYMEPAQTLPLMTVGGSQRDGAGESGKRKASIADSLRVAIGVGTPMRSLHYSDAVSDGLNNYQLGSSFMLEANAVWYPAQNYTASWPRYLGVDFSALGAMPSKSQDSFGVNYRSTYDAYRMGLRARYPVGRHFVHAFSGYSIARGSVQGDPGATAHTPSVDYRALRTGLGTEIALGEDMSVGFDAAWLSVLSAGEIARWFPRSSATGMELGLSATYALGKHWFARAAMTYRRIAFDFNVRPGDARIAGGATDQSVTMSAGAGVSL